MQQQKTVQLNHVQHRFLQHPSRVKVMIGGRGSGKSTILGAHSLLGVTHLPRSKGMLVGLTYAQVLTQILPSMEKLWKMGGYQPYNEETRKGHYIIGRRPPSSWGNPIDGVNFYKNMISFRNGSCIELLSMDRINRGGSYDWAAFDEAALLDKGKHDREIIPSIRGNSTIFPDTWLHHSRVYTTTQSWKQEGMWINEMAERKGVYADSMTAFDNVDNIGLDVIQEWQDTLPDLVWRVEIMNERLTQLPNGFYPNFLSSRHTYWDSFLYTEQEVGITFNRKDIVAQQAIMVSFDFGGKFNCMLTAQEHPGEIRVLDAFYTTRKIQDLLNTFCDAYSLHTDKRIIIYGDRNGNSRVANSEETYYMLIMRLLKARGWTPELRVEGLDPYHKLKYEAIGQTLAETDPRLPKVRINQNTCKPLILSIQTAPIMDDFKKDKRSERKDIPQEQATHLSDAFDNLIYPLVAKKVLRREATGPGHMFR